MADRALGEESQTVGERATETTLPTFLCGAVFGGLGLLIIVATGFKLFDIYSRPMPAFGMVGVLALICFEVSFGTWLLFGVRSAWTLRAAIACFAVFASVSGYKYLAGASSCGCFGTLQVNPAITFVVDAVAVVMLFLCRKGVEKASEARLSETFPFVGSVAISLSLLSVVIAIYGQSRFVRSDSSMTALGDLVVLEPETWIGKRWPLLAEPGVPHELADGTWDVLLFRHDCHVCHDVMVELSQILSVQLEARRITLIGIDEPREDELVNGLRNLGCLLGRLPQDREWFATTPLRLRLKDGACVSGATVAHWEPE